MKNDPPHTPGGESSLPTRILLVEQPAEELLDRDR
jgi:hypothetical protein